MKTVQTIENIKQELASGTDAEINSLPVTRLRWIVRQLGVSHVVREGEPLPVHQARRDELLTEVMGVVAKERALSNAVVITDRVEPASMQAAKVELMSVTEVVERLQAARAGSQIEAEQIVDETAYKFCVEIALTYPDTTDQLRFNVRCARRSDRLAEIRRACPAELSKVYDAFWKQVRTLAAADNTLKRETYDKRCESKIEATVEVRTAKLLDWSVAQLEKCSDWKNVLIALAFVTGRRMNELLYWGTEATKRTDRSLDWNGLSKGKDGNEPAIEDCTTLADADLILKAINWLKQNKGIDERADANKRYGKDTGLRVREVVASTEVLVDPSKAHTTDERGNLVQTVNFHALRKLYVLNAILEASDQSNRGTAKEAQRLLGHLNRTTSEDSYRDVFTLVEYSR